jgi:hypothetical protein
MVQITPEQATIEVTTTGMRIIAQTAIVRPRKVA